MIIPTICPSWTEYKKNKYRKPLSDVISLNVSEKLNGSFDLEMVYPIGGQFSDELSFFSTDGGLFYREAIISAVPRKGAKEEPFRIYEISKSLDGTMTVKAHHIVYDTDGIVVEPFNVTGIAAAINALNTHYDNQGAEFVVSSDIVNTTSQFSTSEPRSLWYLIGHLQSVFGGELSYEYDDYNSRVLIKLNASRGSDKTSVIAYGVNILKASKKENVQDRFNAVLPFAKQKNDDGTVTIVTGDLSAVALPGIDRERIAVVDFSQNHDGLPTAEELYMDAQQYRGNLGKMSNSVSVDFVPLEDTTEGSGESTLGLGDTVTIDADIVEMSMTEKVVQTVFNPLTEKYESISVGSAEQTIADTIVNLSADSVSDPSRLIAKGIERYQSVEAGSTLSIDISYGKTFGKIPSVVATIFSNNSVGIGNCSVSVYNITTTGFQLRLTNNHSSARNLGATWIAM
jgi:phage minor structural protein